MQFVQYCNDLTSRHIGRIATEGEFSFKYKSRIIIDDNKNDISDNDTGTYKVKKQNIETYAESWLK